MTNEGVTQQLPCSDWHIIRSIGIENRGDEVVIRKAGKAPKTIPGVREMVLTIVGEFPAKEIDAVEVNGVRFKQRR